MCVCVKVRGWGIIPLLFLYFVYVPEYMYEHHLDTSALRVQKRHQIPWNWNCRQLCLPACLSMHHMCAGGKGQKRVPGLRKPELQTIMSCQSLKPGSCKITVLLAAQMPSSSSFSCWGGVSHWTWSSLINSATLAGQRTSNNPVFIPLPKFWGCRYLLGGFWGF